MDFAYFYSAKRGKNAAYKNMKAKEAAKSKYEESKSLYEKVKGTPSKTKDLKKKMEKVKKTNV